MQRTASVTVSLIVLFCNSAAAQPGCVVFSSQAQGLNGKLVSLQVGKGHGLNANFIPTGEFIEKVWIDDQSQVGVSFDGNLCQWTSDKQAMCANASASVIHLRQTKLINFPDLPRSQNGSTLLSAITQGESGRKLYQFKVTPVRNAPACSSITILPDPQRFDPLLPASVSQSNQPNGTLNQQWQSQAVVPTIIPSTNNSNQALRGFTPLTSSPGTSNQAAPASTNTPSIVPTTEATPAIPSATKAISNASAATRGLVIAKRTGQIKLNTTMWKKTQSAIVLLRRGMKPDDAANRANVPLPLLTQLIIWGQQ
jgi:hypothetical protein